MGAALRVRAAVCVCDGDRILLVEHVKGGRHRWLLPGGGVEEGETLLEAAARETLEETGLVVDVGRPLLVCEAIEPGRRHLVNIVFLARVVDGDLRAGRDGVLAAVAWRRRSELPALSMHPPIVGDLVEIWAEAFEGPVRFLGNVWRPEDGETP